MGLMHWPDHHILPQSSWKDLWPSKGVLPWPAGPCPSCTLPLGLHKPEEGTPYVACAGAPICRKAVYFPRATTHADVSPQSCAHCPGNMRKVAFR